MREHRDHGGADHHQSRIASADPEHGSDERTEQSAIVHEPEVQHRETEHGGRACDTLDAAQREVPDLGPQSGQEPRDKRDQGQRDQHRGDPAQHECEEGQDRDEPEQGQHSGAPPQRRATR